MGRCRRHPHHSVVGVCAHCLNDRLLALIQEEEDYEDLIQNAHITQMSPTGLSSSTPSGTISKLSRSTARRASMEYNRADVKQVAALYLQKHHSLTSSPQRQPMKTSSPLHQTIIHNHHFIKGEITRKKRSPLWSLLRRHRHDCSIDKRNGYGKEPRHERSDGHIGGVRVFDGVGTENVSETQRRRFASSWRAREAAGYNSRSFCHGDKASYSASMREVHESICRGDASSLLSSPPFASPTSSSKQAYHHFPSPTYHHFPSPTSKYTPQSPLRNEKYCDENTSPGSKHGSYGFNRNFDDYRDHYHSSFSWISSFFSRRNRRSKSISGSDSVCVSQPPHGHSVSASPDVAPRARKSVSFIDEDMIGSPRSIAMKSSHCNVYNKSPDMHGHGHIKSPKTSMNGIEVDAKKQLKSPKGSLYGVFSKSADRQGHAHGRECTADTAAYLLVSNALKSPRAYLSSDTIKSPRAKLASLLTKRRSGTVSIDCGRDVRVSPVPIFTVKRDDLSHHHHVLSCDHHQHGDHHHHHHHHHHHQEHNKDEAVINLRFKDELQKSPKMESMNLMHAEREFLKGPRLGALSAVKQLLKSPKLASVKTMRMESEEDDKTLNPQSTTSWSKALSQTLSPMLGLKHRKKQGIRRQAMGHDGYQYGHRGHQHNDELNGHRDAPYPQHGHHGHHYNENQSSYRDHYHEDHQHGHHHHQHGHGPNKTEELLVRETHVLPALDEKGPPQQYSFLSKDYSAFSFYFSPRHGGNSDGAAHNSHKISVPAADNGGNMWNSFSLSSRAGGGGSRSGRGRF